MTTLSLTLATTSNDIGNALTLHTAGRWCNIDMSDLAPKWVRLAQNGANCALFQIRFQYSVSQNVPIFDLKKSQTCVFWCQSDQL